MQIVKNNVITKGVDSLEYYKIISSFPYQTHPIFYEKDSLRHTYVKLLHHYAKNDEQYQKHYKPLITLYKHWFKLSEEEIFKEQTSQDALRFAKEIKT